MFKDIEGYEGLYQINQLGEVKSLDRIDSGGRKWKGRILKNRRSKKMDICPYLYVKIKRIKVFCTYVSSKSFYTQSE